MFLSPKPKTTPKPDVFRPEGSICLGELNNQPLYLSPRDLSQGVLLVGAPGSGKTVLLKKKCRTHMRAGDPFCVIDKMGTLVDDLLNYYCYCKATGRRIKDIVLFKASDGSWVLPWNPFAQRHGEISVQVDRQVSAVLRVWGQDSGDQTPLLEKWLKVLFFVLIESHLTFFEAATLLDQYASEVRTMLKAGLSSPLIRKKLDDLSRFKPPEFLQQTQSVENRLMRFLTSGHLSRIFGTGQNMIDCQKMFNERISLLVDVQPSEDLSEEQARLIGTMLINDYYQTALTRETGAPPYHLVIDEAASFATPELAQSLEQCRQKGLFVTAAFQHPSQMKEQGERLYKAFKNIRTKIVFNIPDRQDALELADDLFLDSTEPDVKYTHQHLSHLIEDVQRTSTTNASGKGKSFGTNTSHGQSRSLTIGSAAGGSMGRSDGRSDGKTLSRTLTLGTNEQTTSGSSETSDSHESHSSGFTETETKQQSSGGNSSVTTTELKTDNGLFSSYKEASRATSAGHNDNESSSYSRTETGNDSYESGHSKTTTESETSGKNRSLAHGRNHQITLSRGRSREKNWQQSCSRGGTDSKSAGTTSEQSVNSSQAQTISWGAKHTPFLEPRYELRSLEERRWRAAEKLMTLPVGNFIIRSGTRFGFGTTKLPEPFYLLPKTLDRLKEEAYRRHNLTAEQADLLIAQRQARLWQKPTTEPNGGSTWPTIKSGGLWNRSGVGHAQFAEAARRGPKRKTELHAKVAAIVNPYGRAWTSDDNLRQICEQLDQQGVPVPKPWPTLRLHPARSWCRAVEFHQDLVKKAIEYYCRAALPSDN
jgi:hypothetical protein